MVGVEVGGTSAPFLLITLTVVSSVFSVVVDVVSRKMGLISFFSIK